MVPARQRHAYDQEMIALTDLAESLGPGLLQLAVRPDPPPGGAESTRGVADVVIAEPGSGPVGAPGDLVVGAGVPDVDAAAGLVVRAARGGAEGVVLRRALAWSRAVREAAQDNGIALLELNDSASLVHVIGLVRSLVEETTTGVRSPESVGFGVQSDLFVLADAVAGFVDAPVTFEDAQSRVLAYSARQDLTDSARVSTIVGRRVPAELVGYQRGRGVFRRLARSDEPFLVPPGPQQQRPRYVVPVRAGGEWLGSIWVVTSQEPAPAAVRELRQAATVLALHLLRIRAQADLTRRMSSDRLRAWLGGTASGSSDFLPTGPWRVVALGTAAGAGSGADSGDSDDSANRGGGSQDASSLDVWESALRRQGWRQPLLAVLDDVGYAVVQDAPARPGAGDPPKGSWDWLAGVARHRISTDPGMRVAAGSSVAAAGDLVQSRHEARELLGLQCSALVTDRVATVEQAWAALVLGRTAAALETSGILPGGPVETLRRHDEARGTAYLPTLAAWLDHPGEPRAAARALHVHVNTVRHRMMRMGEVVELGLDDAAQRLATRLQLLALGYGCLPPSSSVSASMSRSTSPRDV